MTGSHENRLILGGCFEGLDLTRWSNARLSPAHLFSCDAPSHDGVQSGFCGHFLTEVVRCPYSISQWSPSPKPCVYKGFIRRAGRRWRER